MPHATPTEPTPARGAALALLAALALAAAPARAQADGRGAFRLEEVLGYPYAYPAAAAADADRLAWKVFDRGARNLWTAAAPDFEPVRLTAYTEDDGQNLEELLLTPDGSILIYGRGNGPNRAGEHANPSSDPKGAEDAIWAVATDGGGAPRRLAEGHGAALSPDGRRLLFLQRGPKVFEIDLADLAPSPDGGAPRAEAAAGDAAPEDDGEGAGAGETPKARVLFEVRAGAEALTWSPDGRRIAFVSDRGDHSFVGVYDRQAEAITWLAPSVDRDALPAWSPDGRRVAFVRFPGRRTGERFDLTGGTPFALWVADAATGEGRELWASPPDAGGFAQYYPATPLSWVAGDGGDGRLLFTSEHSGWLHLYSLAVPAPGSAVAVAEPADLTPGECEAEASAVTPDGASAIVSGNCGDLGRRHLWRAPTAGGEARPVTTGDGIETDPVVLGGGLVAFRHATWRRPQEIVVARLDGTEPRSLGPELPPSFPIDALVEPEEVTITASDGVELHAQLFLPPAGASGRDGVEEARHPATLFLHGGPIRQMLPGFHYSDYYARTFAMNQYLASRGYVALALNFRSGIGYGAAFRRAEGQGPRGATEYRDVLAAGLYLRRRADVDPERIGLWGGSYGGYLTALALARDSDLFAAGVDLHGVHDWTLRARELSPGGGWGLSDEMQETALRSSPVADLSTWTSPVLLIHGDDDRNVLFAQTTDLVQRLRARDVPVEVLVFPDEVHGFLRHESWLRAYGAAARFFDRYLGMGGPSGPGG